MIASLSGWSLAISIGAPIAAIIGAITGIYALLARKEIDKWTWNLDANTKAVESLDAALARSEKERTLLESRVMVAESSATSLHISFTSLQTQMVNEQKAREHDQQICTQRIDALTAELHALKGV